MVAGAKESPMHLSVFISALVNLSGSPFNELKSPSFGIRSVTRSRLSHSFSIFLSVKMQESSTFPVSAAVRLIYVESSNVSRLAATILLEVPFSRYSFKKS